MVAAQPTPPAGAILIWFRNHNLNQPNGDPGQLRKKQSREEREGGEGKKRR
jgi:hypothetical protein